MADDKTKRGATGVMPYSVRARSGAPVFRSNHLDWDGHDRDSLALPYRWRERVAETISYKDTQRLGQGGPDPAGSLL